jgi:signal transduction histidine kinase
MAGIFLDIARHHSGNYLSNALKYSPEESSVQVRLTVEGTHVRVAVRDADPGLSPEDQQQIWERFLRSSGAKDHTAQIADALSETESA